MKKAPKILKKLPKSWIDCHYLERIVNSLEIGTENVGVANNLKELPKVSRNCLKSWKKCQKSWKNCHYLERIVKSLEIGTKNVKRVATNLKGITNIF